MKIKQQQTADSRQQTADGRRQTADSRQQTADSRQRTADSRQRTENLRPNFEFQLILTTIVRIQLLHVKILKIYILFQDSLAELKKEHIQCSNLVHLHSIIHQLFRLV